MLTNIIKKSIYLARNAKRPLNSPNLNELNQKDDKNDENKYKNNKKSNIQEKGYSHNLSPTLKKIDKRYNESLKKQQQEQNQVMKGFEQFQKTIEEQNELKRQQKQKKMTRQNFQQELKILEVPKQFRDRMMKKNIQNQLNKLDLSEQLLSQQSEYKIQIGGRSIKSQQQAEQIKRLFLNKNNKSTDINKLKQDVLLNYITKNSKQKSATLNLSQDWKKQLDDKKKQNQEEQAFINEKLSKQIQSEQNYGNGESNNDGNKKKQKYKNNNNDIIYNKEQFRKVQRLKDKHKIEISEDQIWRSKYPPELIQQAMQYKNKQLGYFKDLIESDRRDIWDQRREKEMLVLSKEQKQYNKKHRQLLQNNRIEKKKDLGAVAELKQQEGLTRYQDEEYYKEKGLRQFQQAEKLKLNKSLQSYDKKLQEQGQIDLIKGDKLSEIFIQEFQDPQEKRLQKKQIYEKSSFCQFETKLKNLSKKMQTLGFDYNYEDLALLNKQQLFAEKNIREQNQRYQQYLLKKQKKKKMKQELKKIHKEKLRQDLNYDYQIDPVKLERLNPVDMQEGLKKIEQMKKLKQSQIISQDYLKQKIHHTKTLKAMTQFINAYFYNQIQNPHNNISQKIQVGNIISNPKNTVLNVFWKWKPGYEKTIQKYNFTEDEKIKEKRMIQAKLTKQRNYISSKMTDFLGLRYGPDIRFYFDQKLQETVNAYEQIKKYKNQIVQLSIQEYKQKGVIKTLQQQTEYRRKLIALAENNLQELNNQRKLISKNYKRRQKLLKKLEFRKQQKDKKDHKNKSKSDQETIKKMNRKQTQKQKDEKVLRQVIGKKVEQKKKSIFESALSDQDMKKYFGDDVKEEKKQKRSHKKSSVDKMWDQISKL